jgi:hypothetical protein
MDEVLAAYNQLKNDPSLVLISGQYGGEDGIWAWETYTSNRYRHQNNGELTLTLCFVPSRVSGIAINFYQYYVSATLDRVALVSFDPTRNVTGGHALESFQGNPAERQRLLKKWIKDPFV